MSETGQIKRYELFTRDADTWMEEDNNGEYVKFEDHEAVVNGLIVELGKVEDFLTLRCHDVEDCENRIKQLEAVLAEIKRVAESFPPDKSILELIKTAEV